MKKRSILLNLSLIVLFFMTLGCKKDKKESFKPTLSKENQIGAKAVFRVTKGDGNIEPSEYGLVYSKNSNPTTADTKVLISGSTQTELLSGLDLSATYYVRAFVTDSKGTNYSSEISFTTECIDIDSIFPRHGATGTTVTIYGRGFGSALDYVSIRRYDPTVSAENIVTPTTHTNTQLTFSIPGTFTVGRSYFVGLLKDIIGCNSLYGPYYPSYDNVKDKIDQLEFKVTD